MEKRGRYAMRTWLALLTISAATALGAGAAFAEGSAYCLRGCDFGAGECSFSSYQQCMATASGRTGWCDANPDFRPVNAFQQAGHPRMSRRRL
jgi:uncharacterized protein DUF3551